VRFHYQSVLCDVLPELRSICSRYLGHGGRTRLASEGSTECNRAHQLQRKAGISQLHQGRSSASPFVLHLLESERVPEIRDPSACTVATDVHSQHNKNLKKEHVRPRQHLLPRSLGEQQRSRAVTHNLESVQEPHQWAQAITINEGTESKHNDQQCRKASSLALKQTH
jgi:hypothetical protein